MSDRRRTHTFLSLTSDKARGDMTNSYCAYSHVTLNSIITLSDLIGLRDSADGPVDFDHKRSSAKLVKVISQKSNNNALVALYETRETPNEYLFHCELLDNLCEADQESRILIFEAFLNKRTGSLFVENLIKHTHYDTGITEVYAFLFNCLSVVTERVAGNSGRRKNASSAPIYIIGIEIDITDDSRFCHITPSHMLENTLEQLGCWHSRDDHAVQSDRIDSRGRRRWTIHLWQAPASLSYNTASITNRHTIEVDSGSSGGSSSSSSSSSGSDDRHERKSGRRERSSSASSVGDSRSSDERRSSSRHRERIGSDDVTPGDVVDREVTLSSTSSSSGRAHRRSRERRSRGASSNNRQRREEAIMYPSSPQVADMDHPENLRSRRRTATQSGAWDV